MVVWGPYSSDLANKLRFKKKLTLNLRKSTTVMVRGEAGSFPLLNNIIKCRIIDQYRQDWAIEVYSHDNCTNYRIYKHNFEQENYLLP